MFKKILLPIDYADPASWEKALSVAMEEARHHAANLTVISVIPEIIRLPNLPEDYGKGAKAHVGGTVQKILDEAGAKAELLVAEGSVYREVLKAAHAKDIDLIILASAKGDFPHYPFGPNAARIVRYANCSVFVVRG